MSLRNSREYLEKYKNLKNGYYDYTVEGYEYNLYTIFEDNSGWIRVVIVDFNNQSHLTEEQVTDVKLHDGVINQLRTDCEYNVLASAEVFKKPYNEWLQYPHNMYVHRSMKYFSSIKNTMNNQGSTLVSFNISTPPMQYIKPSEIDIGFGSGKVGDTLFAYGSIGQNGFFQSFSGSGRGAVYVR